MIDAVMIDRVKLAHKNRVPLSGFQEEPLKLVASLSDFLIAFSHHGQEERSPNLVF
jgi:hypothetical protein